MAIEATFVAFGAGAGIEAYKVWNTAPFARWVFAGLAAAFAAAGLFIQPLTEAAPKVGEFISSMNTPTFWGVFLIGLFFLLRPLWSPKASESQADVAYDDAELRAKAVEADTRSRAAEEAVAALKETLTSNYKKARERLDKLEAQYAKVIDDYQSMKGLEVRFEESRDKVANEIANLDARDMANHSAAIARLDQLQREYTAHHSLNADALKQRFDSIQHSLLAIYYREQMLSLAKQIDERAAKLAAAIEGGDVLTLDQWTRWQAEETAWRVDVGDWSQMASFYIPGAREKIEAPDKHIYEKGGWHFREEQFPTNEGQPLLRSNAVHQYKTFRIAAGRWDGVRDSAHDVVRMVAFDGFLPDHFQGKS